MFISIQMNSNMLLSRNQMIRYIPKIRYIPHPWEWPRQEWPQEYPWRERPRPHVEYPPPLYIPRKTYLI